MFWCGGPRWFVGFPLPRTSEGFHRGAREGCLLVSIPGDLLPFWVRGVLYFRLIHPTTSKGGNNRTPQALRLLSVHIRLALPH